uniref:DUF4537 domain-containing protein n=1 Tax=Macrostomum lignano TaxID=282301 RepID=A0A1I8H068_9PLAT
MVSHRARSRRFACSMAWRQPASSLLALELSGSSSSTARKSSLASYSLPKPMLARARLYSALTFLASSFCSTESHCLMALLNLRSFSQEDLLAFPVELGVLDFVYVEKVRIVLQIVEHALVMIERLLVAAFGKVVRALVFGQLHFVHNRVGFRHAKLVEIDAVRIGRLDDYPSLLARYHPLAGLLHTLRDALLVTHAEFECQNSTVKKVATMSAFDRHAKLGADGPGTTFLSLLSTNSNGCRPGSRHGYVVYGNSVLVTRNVIFVAAAHSLHCLHDAAVSTLTNVHGKVRHAEGYRWRLRCLLAATVVGLVALLRSVHSEDIRLLREEYELGKGYLDRVAALRDECHRLAWKRETAADSPEVAVARSTPRCLDRPQSAPNRVQKKTPRSARQTTGKRGGAKVQPPAQPLLAINADRSEDWVLPETREMLARQRERDALRQQEHQRQQHRQRNKEMLREENMSSKQWLKRHGLAAQRMTILDALSPTIVQHRPKYVPILNRMVLARVFDDIMPIAYASPRNRQSIQLVNPAAVDLKAYKAKLRKLIEKYNKRLDSLILSSLTKEQLDELSKQCDGEERPDFDSNKAAFYKALEQARWPVSESDVFLLEKEVEKARLYLQQADDLQRVSSGKETPESTREILSEIQRSQDDHQGSYEVSARPDGDADKSGKEKNSKKRSKKREPSPVESKRDSERDSKRDSRRDSLRSGSERIGRSQANSDKVSDKRADYRSRSPSRSPNRSPNNSPVHSTGFGELVDERELSHDSSKVNSSSLSSAAEAAEPTEAFNNKESTVSATQTKRAEEKPEQETAVSVDQSSQQEALKESEQADDSDRASSHLSKESAVSCRPPKMPQKQQQKQQQKLGKQKSKPKQSKKNPKTAAAPGNSASEAQQREAERRALDSLRGQRVIARNEEDGLYYAGLVECCPDMRTARIRYDELPKSDSLVPTRFCIPICGALSYPILRTNDTVLAQVRNLKNRVVCFAPARVLVPPKDESRGQKFYCVRLYNGKKCECTRSSLIKIGETRYTFLTRALLSKGRGEDSTAQGDEGDDHQRRQREPSNERDGEQETEP